ncbi:hypothetical protein N309_12814, partial [Tinamus guttatus]
AGSQGIDLVTTIAVTLVDTKPRAVPAGWYKPKGNLGALLLGRSSAGLQGLIVMPGVIDADFAGEVKIVLYTLHPPIVVPVGSRLAQLVPLTNLLQTLPLSSQVGNVRGDKGFGSTGPAACLSLQLRQRPTIKVKLCSRGEQISIPLLLDTGADVTMIS